MNRAICVALSIRGGDVMASILEFMGRNMRIALAGVIVAACVGAAGAIGWMTAPL